MLTQRCFHLFPCEMFIPYSIKFDKIFERLIYFTKIIAFNNFVKHIHKMLSIKTEVCDSSKLTKQHNFSNCKEKQIMIGYLQ